MSEWYTETGETQPNVKSNLLPENTPQEPVCETSFHAEVIYRDGEATYREHKGTEHQADQGVNLDNGILASARTEGGGRIHGRRVIASDQVMLPGGMPTNASVAADLGYLIRNPDGSFSEVILNEGTGTANENETEEGAVEFHIGDAGEAAMDKIVGDVETSASIAALGEILTHGEVSAQTLERMAASSAMEPYEVAELVNAAHLGFYEAGAEHMARLGVTDADAFMAFLGDNPQVVGKMAEGAHALVMGQGTEGLDTLAAQFMEHADHYMTQGVIDALDTAGFEHRPDGKGGLIVITNDGAEVPFQVAVRQKIVRFN